MNKNTVFNILGVTIVLVYLSIGFIKLGWIPMWLLIIFIAQAVQDAINGRVNALTFLPIVMVPFFYPWEIFFKLFMLPVGALAIIWLLIRELRRREKIPEEIVLGLGDVLGVPFALTVSWVLLPFWGVPVFGASTGVLIPILLRAKQRRLLPWLLPGLMVCFVTALFLSL